MRKTPAWNRPLTLPVLPHQTAWACTSRLSFWEGGRRGLTPRVKLAGPVMCYLTSNAKPRYLSEMLLAALGLGGETKQGMGIWSWGMNSVLLLLLDCLSVVPRDKAPLGCFPPHRRIGRQTQNRAYFIKWSVSVQAHLATITLTKYPN